jgi:fibro-slime domain-containing protein
MRNCNSSLLIIAFLLGAVGCSAGGNAGRDGDGSGSGNGSGGQSTSTGSIPSTTDGVIIPGGPLPNPCEAEDAPENCELIPSGPACGDGEINQDSEACDDGNSLPGDGCSGICAVEAYHECPTPGQPCVSTIVCGDGVLGPGEACDDANTADGDGCSKTCNLVETGYVCREAGAACVRVYICGDGSTDPNEGCDDGNLVGGDGCDERCRIEVGFKCEGSPARCSPTTCGDGVLEGAESCDDGNTVPFDGCSPTCRAEPVCATGMACSSSCGDGITLNDEECDDGNLRDGDGCSSSCTQEDGFTCAQPEGCAGEDCILELPILYRDFTVAHSDFGVACGTIQRNVPEALLSMEGKPVLSANGYPDACIASAASFAEWYTNAGTNYEIVSTIRLYDNGSGGFVNRYGENGEQYMSPPVGNGRWCGNLDQYADCAEASAAGQCNAPAFDPDVDTCWEVGATLPDDVPPNCCTNCFCAGTVTLQGHDGNPLFFPIENSELAPDLAVASIPEEVYDGGWQEDPSGLERNFFFTSEIAYWFEYTDGMTAELSFVGDDDVWVYVNGRLAVDLGGLHVPVEGRFTLNANGSIDLIHGTDGTGDRNEPANSSVTNFGLAAGNVYEVKVFHAERKMNGSSYKLTLSGFNAGPSDCQTDCGDGEIGPGELCDDGPSGNTGEYNQCTPQCTLGPRCGDAIVQDQFGEVCDDGLNDGAYGGCAPTCQLGPHCGDAVVQGEFEQCDDGNNDGGYGECAPGCVLGPYCGDGNISLGFEECDDGGNENGDGCSAACKEEKVVPQ